MLHAEDLFALSDTLQMELHVSAQGKITGTMKKVLMIDDIGLKMNLTPEVVSARYDKDVIALIVKVQGDLHLLVVHDRSGAGMITAMILDKAKHSGQLEGFFEGVPNMMWAMALNLLRKCSVSESVKQEYGDIWMLRTAA